MNKGNGKQKSTSKRAPKDVADGKPPKGTVRGFHIKSPCGRAWFLPEGAIVADYAHFLETEDGLSAQDAAAQAQEDCDIEDWLASQFNWDDVKKYGTLTKQASPEDIERALNSYQHRSGSVTDDCEPIAQSMITVAPAQLAFLPATPKVTREERQHVADVINFVASSIGTSEALAFAAHLKAKIGELPE